MLKANVCHLFCRNLPVMLYFWYFNLCLSRVVALIRTVRRIFWTQVFPGLKKDLVACLIRWCDLAISDSSILSSLSDPGARLGLDVEAKICCLCRYYTMLLWIDLNILLE